MDPYLTLRQQAAIKRDVAIAAARKLYKADIEAIEKLQRSIPPQSPMAVATKRGPNTVELIRTLLPPDKPFTLTDVMHWLHDATNGQTFKEPTIRCYLWKLSRRGIVRKLYKTGQNDNFAFLDVDADSF